MRTARCTSSKIGVPEWKLALAQVPKLGGILLVVVLAISIFGCAGHRANPGQVMASPAGVAEAKEVLESPTGYVIQAGDVLDVKFAYDPNLNEQVIVRPDGKISLQLVEEITAEGKEPAALTKELSEEYAKVLREPKVTVIVREFSALKVYVGGEVYIPRMLPLTGHMSALQAVLGAGGFKDQAKPASVIIVSKGTNNLPIARTVNLALVLAGDPKAEDPVLRPFDVVYVPKTFIAKANQFVDQYIRKMIPGNLSAAFHTLSGEALLEEHKATQFEQPSLRVDLRELLSIINRHKHRIALLCLSAIVTASLMSYVLSERFRSEAVILIRPQKSPVAVPSKEEMLDFPVSYFTPVEDTTKTYTEMLQSAVIAERIVAQLGADSFTAAAPPKGWRGLLIRTKRGVKTLVSKTWTLLKYRQDRAGRPEKWRDPRGSEVHNSEAYQRDLPLQN